MLVVYVWHAVFTHFQKPSKKSNIVFVFPKISKRASIKVEKVIEKRLQNHPRTVATSDSCEVRPSFRGASPHCSGGKCPSTKGFPYFLFTQCCHIERGRNLCPGRECPMYSPLQSVLRWLRLWSQTGVSCKPSCRLVTWYRGSAVPGWSSSCQIFSYSSFSSSFCG